MQSGCRQSDVSWSSIKIRWYPPQPSRWSSPSYAVVFRRRHRSIGREIIWAIYLCIQRRWIHRITHPYFGLAASRDEESPFAELDALYRQIFTAVANFNLKDILEALSIFFLADAKCVKKSPRNIERFLPGPFSPGRVRITLSDLHSEIGSCQKKKMGPLRLSILHWLIFFLLLLNLGFLHRCQGCTCIHSESFDQVHNSGRRFSFMPFNFRYIILTHISANSTIDSPERHGFLYHCLNSGSNPHQGVLDWISNILLVRRLTPAIVPKYSLNDIQQFLIIRFFFPCEKS